VSKHRQILDLVDETAVPYGVDYEYAVMVMTARTKRVIGAVWETFAELPDGSEISKEHASRNSAERSHKLIVEMVINRMDSMGLSEAEAVLKVSGMKSVDGIGGYIAQKAGVTYIRRNGKWEAMESRCRGVPTPGCPQCAGKGLHINTFGFEVECDCRMGAWVEEIDCPRCVTWTDPGCFKCSGTGFIRRRKRKLF
jgi:hypothetical protein